MKPEVIRTFLMNYWLLMTLIFVILIVVNWLFIPIPNIGSGALLYMLFTMFLMILL